MGEGGGFLDADGVVFEPEIGIDVVLILEVADAQGGRWDGMRGRMRAD